jgi:hypothetical protein
MLRLTLAVSLLAMFGCQQPDLPPVAGYEPPPRIVRAVYHPPAVVRGRPIAWCADPRPNDPLLFDGIELGTFSDDDGSVLDDIRALHRISPVPVDEIALVTDEVVCERAARAYDAARFIYRSSPPGRSIEPVFVVSVGRVYLVESAGDRRHGYEVKVFDRSWTHLRGGFGVEF